MKEIELRHALAAVLQNSLSARYRHAYLHDMRGGLQAIHNALELITRSTKSSGSPADMLEKASQFAKRAIASHDKSIERILDQLILRDEEPIPLDAGEAIGEIIRFMQNDVASKGIAFDFPASGTVTVLAPPNLLRLVILGLLTDAVDAMPGNTRLRVELRLDGSHASLELSAGHECQEISALAAPPDFSKPVQWSDLTLAVARQFLAATAEPFILDAHPTAATLVRICCPAFSSPEPPAGPPPRDPLPAGT